MFNLTISFSIYDITGMNNKKYKKYNNVEICPNSIYGLSTCLAPNTIKLKNIATKL